MSQTSRITAIELDDKTITWRNADIEQERRVAIFDLLEDNHFAPRSTYEGGYLGPFNVMMRVEEGRLALDVAAEDKTPLETIVLSLSPFRRVIRDYFGICDSYFKAIKTATPAQIEAVDMGRRGIHNEGSEKLRDVLSQRVEIDFDTARRLFTLICVLHIKG